MELFNPISDIAPYIIERLANEYEAHYLYANAANWCDNTGYTLAADFFKKEAADELVHAGKLQKFLNNWGVFFTIPSVTVEPKFTSLPDIIKKGYAIEVELYKSYNSDVEQIEKMDKSTYSLLLEMVNIQYDSVAEYRTLIDKLNLIDDTDKFQVFMYEKEVFE